MILATINSKLFKEMEFDGCAAVLDLDAHREFDFDVMDMIQRNSGRMTEDEFLSNYLAKVSQSPQISKLLECQQQIATLSDHRPLDISKRKIIADWLTSILKIKHIGELDLDTLRSYGHVQRMA